MTKHSPNPRALPPLRNVDRYFYVWTLVLPITSFLVFPSVQGTTLSFILSLILVGLIPFLSRQGISEYYRTLGYFAAFFGALAVLSQLGMVTRSVLPDTSQLLVIKPDVIKGYMRMTLFTQSIYLLCGLSLFSFVRIYYTPRWDNYFFLGAVLLALYGLYEWGYFLGTGGFGDFITNRVFSDSDELGTAAGIEGSGSLMQTVQLGPLNLLRLKSLTGEPSMYSFAILPFWIYATHLRRWGLSFLFLFTLFLTTSSTAMVGIAVYALCTITDRKTFGFKVGVAILGFVVFLFNGDLVMDTINMVFLEKMSSHSGEMRTEIFLNQIDFFLTADPWLQLFGLGFGYTRSGSIVLTMLINCGIIGAIGTVGFILYPIVKLGLTRQENAIRLALFVLFFSSLTSAGEFTNMPFWLFLGLAYAKLRQPLAERRIEWNSSDNTSFIPPAPSLAAQPVSKIPRHS